MSFANFLKEQNYGLYKEYILEVLTEKGIAKKAEPDHVKMPAPVFKEKTSTNAFLKYCTPLNKLHHAHPAVEYLSSRMVPVSAFSKVYWIDNIQDLRHFDLEGKYDFDRVPAEGRILFPFFSEEGLVGISGRSIDPNTKKRYVIYKFDDAKPSIFGFYDANGKLAIDKTQRIYITEGAVDSLFLPNAIAVNGSDLPKLTRIFSSIDSVFIPDNEPRNKQIVKVYDKIINTGNNVCIFPSIIIEKDINEMVLVYGSDYIKDLIDDNNFSGLTAKLKLVNWRKC